MFLARLDPSPKQSDKPTVEACEYVRHRDNKTHIWFGLSTGELQNVVLERQETRHRLPVHRQIVTCLCATDDTHLWSGSFDRTIKVLNMKTRRVVATLTGHSDAVTCLLNDGKGTLVSGSLNGQLIHWDIAKKKLCRRAHILQCPETNKTLNVYSLKLVDDEMWVGTGNAIAIVDPVTLSVRRVMSSTSTSPKSSPFKGKESVKSKTTVGGWGAPRSALAHQSQTNLVRNRSSSMLSSSPKNPGRASPSRHHGKVSPTPNSGSWRSSRGGSMNSPRNSKGRSGFKPLAPSVVPQAPERVQPFYVQKDAVPVKPRVGFFADKPVSNTGSAGDVAEVSMNVILRPHPLSSDDPDRRYSTPLKQTPLSKKERMNSLGQRPEEQPDSPIAFTAVTPERRAASESPSVGEADSPRSAMSEGDISSPESIDGRRRSFSAGSVPAMWGGGGDAGCRTRSKRDKTKGGPNGLLSVSSGDREHSPAPAFGPFGGGGVVAHCIAVGPNGMVWSCSENRGLIQLWSAKTYTLKQSWEVACTGLNHIAFSRGHAWVAGADGSLYIFDAELLLPVIEIKAHVASVRAVCIIAREYVLSLSASVDGTVGVFRAAARGRITGVGVPSPSESIALYDRYGFLTLPSENPEPEPRKVRLEEAVGKGRSTILSESLPEEQKQALWTRQREQANHLHAWDHSVSTLIEAPDAVVLARNDPKLRKLIEVGVPDKYRKVVWRALLRSWTQPGKPSPSPREVRDGMSENTKMARQIEVDLQRTFPTNKHFEAGGAALERLRRVLYRYVVANSKVQYCQGFNFIAGFALLFLDENAALQALSCIIESIMPPGYFTDPMLTSRADQPVFRAAVAKWIPEVDEILQKFEFDLSLVTFNWFFTVFVDCCPTTLSIRIWDLLFLYGDITLFRFAYALIKLNSELIASVTDQFELFVLMRGLGTNESDHDEVTRIALTECPITHEFLVEMREFHTERIAEMDRVVKVEIAERRQREEELKAQKAASLESTSSDTQPAGVESSPEAPSSPASSVQERDGADPIECPATPTATGLNTTDDNDRTPMSTPLAESKSGAPLFPGVDDAPLFPRIDVEDSTAVSETTREDGVLSPPSVVDIGAAAFARRTSAGSQASLPNRPDGNQRASPVAQPPPKQRVESPAPVSRKDRSGSDVSILSSGSWVQIDKADVVPTFQPLKAKSSEITVFKNVELGGTGDGFLEPSQSLAHSVSRWTTTRLKLRNTNIPTVGPNSRSSPRSSTSSGTGSPTNAQNSATGVLEAVKQGLLTSTTKRDKSSLGVLVKSAADNVQASLGASVGRKRTTPKDSSAKSMTNSLKVGTAPEDNTEMFFDDAYVVDWEEVDSPDSRSRSFSLNSRSAADYTSD